MKFIQSDVNKINEILVNNNITKIDIIISTLPYKVFIENPAIIERLGHIKKE